MHLANRRGARYRREISRQEYCKRQENGDTNTLGHMLTERFVINGGTFEGHRMEKFAAKEGR